MWMKSISHYKEWGLHLGLDQEIGLCKRQSGDYTVCLFHINRKMPVFHTKTIESILEPVAQQVWNTTKGIIMHITFIVIQYWYHIFFFKIFVPLLLLYLTVGFGSESNECIGAWELAIVWLWLSSLKIVNQWSVDCSKERVRPAAVIYYIIYSIYNWHLLWLFG